MFNSLKTVVAIITIDIRTPHFAMVSYNFEQEFTKKGFNVLKHHVDGIAFVGSIFTKLNDMPDVLDMLKEIPIVIANGSINLANCNSVLADESCGKYKTEYKDYVFDVEQSIDGGSLGAKEILERDPSVEAIICGNDIVGVINYLNKLGIKPGHDIDVVGYNNTLYSEITTPKMTIVNNKPGKHHSGRLCCDCKIVLPLPILFTTILTPRPLELVHLVFGICI